ncbi:hypothetical protein BC940DRAFT_331083 [Gongronella butleri]|nr:hypothetical protein BC940DRAFT_331083 [Gongronella butleri]
MWPFLFAYVLLALLYYVEYRYESARTNTMLQTAGNDEGTTSLLLMAAAIAAVGGVLLVAIGLGGSFSDDAWTFGHVMTWVALGWILGGMILLRWAIYCNAFYIRAMATTDDQYLCTDGPYKVLRHPGYLAFLLAWWGFAVASGNWLLLILIFIGMTYVYVRRVQAEEQMMLERFGVDYQQYMNESFRLIPFIF